jgi:hypothetical protein
LKSRSISRGESKTSTCSNCSRTKQLPSLSISCSQSYFKIKTMDSVRSAVDVVARGAEAAQGTTTSQYVYCIRILTTSDCLQFPTKLPRCSNDCCSSCWRGQGCRPRIHPELHDARPVVKLFYLGALDASQKLDKVVNIQSHFLQRRPSHRLASRPDSHKHSLTIFVSKP